MTRKLGTSSVILELHLPNNYIIINNWLAHHLKMATDRVPPEFHQEPLQKLFCVSDENSTQLPDYWVEIVWVGQNYILQHPLREQYL